MMSLCRILCACMYSTPSQICLTMLLAWSSVRRFFSLIRPAEVAVGGVLQHQVEVGLVVKKSEQGCDVGVDEVELDLEFSDELGVNLLFNQSVFLDNLQGANEVGCLVLGEVDIAEFALSQLPADVEVVKLRVRLGWYSLPDTHRLAAREGGQLVVLELRKVRVVAVWSFDLDLLLDPRAYRRAGVVDGTGQWTGSVLTAFGL